MPRPTDEQIAAAVQTFLDQHEFDKDDPPSRKVLENFATESGYPFNRIRYQMRVSGYNVTPYLDASDPTPPPDDFEPVWELTPPTPAEKATEYVKAHFERLSKFEVYDQWFPVMNETGLKYHILKSAFDNEKKSRL